MIVPEQDPAEADAEPREAEALRELRPRLARAASLVRPGVERVSARVASAVGPRVTRWGRFVRDVVPGYRLPGAPEVWRFTAGAATAGIVLTVGVVNAVGPWDSTGQRTAEREHAVALSRSGGADHGRAVDAYAVTGPRSAPSAAAVLAAVTGPVGRARTPGTSGTQGTPGASDERGGTGVPASGAGAAGPAAPAPAPGALGRLLGPLLSDPSLGDRHSAAVVDVATGRRLYAEGAGTALTPASITKIATAVAALSSMGGDHRFTTRAVLRPLPRNKSAGPGELVLVGGGDPTLTARPQAQGAASLRTLAVRTAQALERRGVHKVTLAYDTSLFTGPVRHPIGVNDNVAPVTALTADEGRTDDSSSGPAPRVADPAGEAARAFAGFLTDHGVQVKGTPSAGRAAGGARTVASVDSPPLSSVVERMLTNSDNDIAEALARQTAVATGGHADFAGGAAAVRAQLARLKLPLTGARFTDGSGLNRADQVTANLMTSLLTLAAAPDHPELRPALTGLPVASFSGTLAERYGDGGAAGLVRAKTGTLTGVNTLAGTVVDADGRLLAFAFLASGTTDPQAAQSALDRTATALAGCGCR